MFLTSKVEENRGFEMLFYKSVEQPIAALFTLIREQETVAQRGPHSYKVAALAFEHSSVPLPSSLPGRHRFIASVQNNNNNKAGVSILKVVNRGLCYFGKQTLRAKHIPRGLVLESKC